MTRVWAVLIALLSAGVTACTNGPTTPGSLGVEVSFSYRSVVPASLPWPAEMCGTSQDRRPVLMMDRGNGGLTMEPDAVDPQVWGARAVVPVDVTVSVSVRDPGLCRMPDHGDFAWSGLTVNDTLVGVDLNGPDGRGPSFIFRVGSDGEIIVIMIVQEQRDASR